MSANVRKKGESVLIISLAAGKTLTEAAALARVNEKTVRRRLEDPAFRRLVDEARTAAIGRACGSLADASTAAVATLRELLSSSSATARLGSARTILELGTRLRESVELEERLQALESRLPAEKKP